MVLRNKNVYVNIFFICTYIKKITIDSWCTIIV